MFLGRVGRLWAFVTAALLISGCEAWQADPDGFTEQDRAVIQGMKLGDVPADVTNEVWDDANAQSLGHLLFFDNDLAGAIAVSQEGPGKLGDVGQAGRFSCADCHTPRSQFSD